MRRKNKMRRFDVEYIHTGPVIRREEIFAKYSIDERRKLLYWMLSVGDRLITGERDDEANSL